MPSKDEQAPPAAGDDADVVLPGFRFHPTDVELVHFYLRRKATDHKKQLPLAVSNLIRDVDVYKHDPWDLHRFGSAAGSEKEWYFFCQRGRKYKNSIRPNRVTGAGFWKATGIDRPIYSSSGETGVPVGLKKSLVYYRGKAGKGTKTDWMMHEYRLPTPADTNPSLDAGDAEIWTICRIFKRAAPSTKRTTTQGPKQFTDCSSSSLTNASAESIVTAAPPAVFVADSNGANSCLPYHQWLLPQVHQVGYSDCINYQAGVAAGASSIDWVAELGRFLELAGDAPEMQFSDVDL